ncbi:MAG: chorismate-binding protein [Bdellovibrionota bacterium]
MNLSFEQFAKEAKCSKIIGIGTSMYCDHETAVTLADRYIDEEYFFLLESATSGPANVARYSFLGFEPLWLWQCQDQKILQKLNNSEMHSVLEGKNPIACMYEDFSKLKLTSMFSSKDGVRSMDLSTLGGAVGYIGFDVCAKLEPKIGHPPKKELGLPDLLFYIPRNFMVLDQLTRQLHVYRYVSVDKCEEDSLQKLYDYEMEQFETLVADLAKVHMPPPIRVKSDKIDYDKMKSSFSKEKFFNAAQQCLHEIRRGEIFQVQIGNRLSCETTARPFDIFRHLRVLNPSPYMFFYKFNEHHILGSSPEIMVGVEEKTAIHRPIAGTRKRKWDFAKDQLMKSELVNSEKERAEHIMLVDLSRNDLGRIAEVGTVKVDELMIVEEYSHVFHMVSQVSCAVRKNFNPADVMSFSFPNGTVSGAPKVRAIEIIYEHEPVSREFYAGSLALFDFAGNLKSTILIRSIYLANGVAATQASAGMVFDSIVDQEWLETRNKMAACVTVMQNTI